MKILPIFTAITASLLFSACAADTSTSTVPTPPPTAAGPVKAGPVVATMSTQPVMMAANQPVVATGINDTSPIPTAVASSGQLGGQLASSMDSLDRSHLSHGLDGPVGRATQWISARSGVQYTLIPTRKFTMNGNSFCRQYTLTATRGAQSRTISGSACVDQNSNWESVA